MKAFLGNGRVSNCHSVYTNYMPISIINFIWILHSFPLLSFPFSFKDSSRLLSPLWHSLDFSYFLRLFSIDLILLNIVRVPLLWWSRVPLLGWYIFRPFFKKIHAMSWLCYVGNFSMNKSVSFMKKCV